MKIKRRVKMRRYKIIATRLEAAENCSDGVNPEWEDKHLEVIDKQMETAPSGSGFNSGTDLMFNESTGKKLVFDTAFQHMNDSGSYVRWTNHKVIITPAFDGFDMRITGKNFNGIKEYIGDVFYNWLSEDVQEQVEQK